ncbi:MAG: response regulator transcription factor [Gemmatimonadetes bacterium]|nr:response regulator transcription factor [Gemmatimonadota bacterium]MDA1104149.1 response regulator transcription factor [Gemmatimonadota bacterium]
MTSESTLPLVPRVLVVEDEPDIAALIAYQLTREGFRVETVGSGPDALAAIDRELPHLVVLDRMLPGLSGDEVLLRIRSEPSTAKVPVLVLTARREQEDRIEGLQLGADDYLTKPFSPRELVLRAHAILRRMHGTESSPGGRVFRAGPIRVDIGAHRAELNGVELDLTPTEFRLLRALIERPGRTQSRRQLLEKAWAVEPGVSDRLHTRTVDMHVRRLRAKLGVGGRWIQTVRGFGYRLKVPEGIE